MTDYARLLLTGGPFDGHEAARLKPDLAPPAQISWAGVVDGRFEAWLYEWSREVIQDENNRAETLVYRPVRRLAPADFPPVMADLADVWADGAILLSQIRPLHPNLRIKLDGTL